MSSSQKLCVGWLSLGIGKGSSPGEHGCIQTAEELRSLSASLTCQVMVLFQASA